MSKIGDTFPDKTDNNLCLLCDRPNLCDQIKSFCHSQLNKICFSYEMIDYGHLFCFASVNSTIPFVLHSSSVPNCTKLFK